MNINRDNAKLLNESIRNILWGDTQINLEEQIDFIVEEYLSEEYITEQVDTYLSNFSDEEIQLICEAYETKDEEVILALEEGFLTDLAREAGSRIKDKAVSAYKGTKKAIKSGIEGLEAGKEKLKRGLAKRSEFVRTAMEKGAARRMTAARDTKEKKGIGAALTRDISLTRAGKVGSMKTDVESLKGSRKAKNKKLLAQARQSSRMGTINSKGQTAKQKSKFGQYGDIARGDEKGAKRRLTKQSGTGASGFVNRLRGKTK
jgi:hypothetical protein